MVQASESGVQEVKSAVPAGVIDSAKEVGVDVDSVVQENITKHSDYSVKTVARFVKTELQSRVEAEQADELSGIIMGSRDRYGRNWPRRHSLVRSDKENVEVSTWDGELPGPSGQDVDIPIGGAVVKMACNYDDQYESWEGKAIRGIREMDPAELVEALEQVAVSPDFLSRDDEYEVVVVKGEIAYINPQTVFVGGKENQENWYDGEVMIEDERGELQPHFEVSLRTEGNQRVRGSFERQGAGRPFTQVPDLEKMLHDAMRHRDTPEKQARFLTDGLQGEEIILVGNVNNFDTSRDDDGAVHYVNIGLTAMVSLDDTRQVSIEESATADEPEPAPEPDEAAETSPSPTEAVAEVRADIEKYCELTGTDIGSLTVDDVNENIQGVDASDVAIRAALSLDDEAEEEVQEEPDQEDEAEDYGAPFDPGDFTVPDLREKIDEVDDKNSLVNLLTAEQNGKDRKTAKETINSRAEELDKPKEQAQDLEAGDDPFDVIEEDGLYHCPGQDGDDDCLFQAGSTGELVAHIVDDHGADGDPKEWVRAQIEG